MENKLLSQEKNISYRYNRRAQKIISQFIFIRIREKGAFEVFKGKNFKKKSDPLDKRTGDKGPAFE